MKTISFFLALINSLFAGFLILFGLSRLELQQAGSWWLLIKILVAGSIILIGILTWMGTLGYLRPSLAALTSIYLIALGASTTVWTFHRAQVSGNMEYYLFIYGGSLFMQGVTLLFGISPVWENTSTA